MEGTKILNEEFSSKIWCEEALVDACAEEFSETPRMLATAEEICGPYDWKVYDVLMLPPNYLYSGMEYPCLAYLSPTLLAGDKSLAYVLAHEMSHCWTGNLVTNRNLEHLWLNAGFSMFIEGKILGRVFGAQMRDYHAVQFLGELQDIVSLYVQNRLQHRIALSAHKTYSTLDRRSIQKLSRNDENGR